jgi:hypothetical protein
MAVVDIARLQHQHMARRALNTRTTTIELLHALLGETDEIRVMPVRIVGMPFEMRTQRFYSGSFVLV